MKTGCVFTIVVIVVAYLGYTHLLADTAIEPKGWISFVLALILGMVIGSFHGLILAFKIRGAANRPRSEWKDGDFVVISGKIHALRSPLEAPFSGMLAAVVEYSINREFSKKANGDDYSGFMMARSAIQSLAGSVSLIGFPMLAKISPSIVPAETARSSAAKFINKTKFTVRKTNPLEAIKQFSEILNSQTDELQAHFISPTIKNFGGSTDATDKLYDQLSQHTYSFEERLIPNGAEVTVSGTYNSSRQAINISSGLTNLSHTLSLGSSKNVVGRSILQPVIWIVILGGFFVVANIYLLGEIGMLDSNILNYLKNFG